ncbi:hypothetical protein HPT25_10395 [Bacillus sp. BRMEA1]|uniref:hypothetical protein n=1 Tax=Neobacillus endophyticus TaxID=2738405 RepID=UPI0015674982|nr:hypothetical protein [Neobacillus endophyticus]NRD77817.1 hypothetical protein [Neobacillus endophyticus]
MKTSSKDISINGQMPQIKVFTHPFASPAERREFLKNLATSAEFNMRHRGLFQYYGKDFINYKREKPLDSNRNEFLRLISKFMTDFLEDNCPSSWQQCQPAFWEELIFTCFPHLMTISPKENQVETFHSQIKKFVRWLDKKTGTSWFPVVKIYTEESFTDLKICERLLHKLFLRDYPLFHHRDWNPQQDLDKLHQKLDQYTDSLNSIFEITSMIEDTTVLTEFKTNHTFYINGLPRQLIQPGLIMSGMIGKRNGELAWEWFQTEGIYPNRGKKYIQIK